MSIIKIYVIDAVGVGRFANIDLLFYSNASNDRIFPIIFLFILLLIHFIYTSILESHEK